MQPVHDVARIRLDNALLLFDEYVHAQVKHSDAAALRGLERRFAERLQIQASYWSQIKGRSRQIGERLARQFEHLCHKPSGWMDQPHDAVFVFAGDSVSASAPKGDDERFIVDLVLSYYRRHPERARARLLELLGEALTPSTSTPPSAAVADPQTLRERARSGGAPLKRRR